MPPPPAVTSGETPRLKRENCHRTKHDSAFSKWKILVGPTDWSDHEKGKQGAERYRVQNLPKTSAPGLYELGVAVCATGSGREVGRLDSSDIVAVYLGEADNVRTRLQRHARGGSHLGIGGGGGGGLVRCGDGGGFGLFGDVFERGFPVVFRWAPMNSKMEAKRTEAQLLSKFDYAWNKVDNGSRRRNDILQKIDKISSQTFQVPRIFKRLQSISHKQVGITIKPSQSPSREEDNANVNDNAHKDSHSLLAQVFKLARSRPRLVFNRPSIIEDKVLTYDGACKSSFTSGSSGAKCDPHFSSEVKRSSPTTDAHSCNKGMSPICGVILLDGSTCMEKPFCGRKRCEEHKGRRITQSVIPKRYFINDATYHNESKVEPASASSESSSSVPVDHDHVCGVILNDGSCCRKQPAKGRKRCEEHKGMRVKRVGV